MVTGIEATGLVLALLPLLVNQRDNYVQGPETLKSFKAKRYPRELESSEARNRKDLRKSYGSCRLVLVASQDQGGVAVQQESLSSSAHFSTAWCFRWSTVLLIMKTLLESYLTNLAPDILGQERRRRCRDGFFSQSTNLSRSQASCSPIHSTCWPSFAWTASFPTETQRLCQSKSNPYGRAFAMWSHQSV